MIRVTTSTGEAFVAETAADIVRLMIRSDRLARRKRLVTFMAATADRCRLWNGSEINASSCEAFLQSLADAGFILRSDDADPPTPTS